MNHWPRRHLGRAGVLPHPASFPSAKPFGLCSAACRWADLVGPCAVVCAHASGMIRLASGSCHGSRRRRASWRRGPWCITAAITSGPLEAAGRTRTSPRPATSARSPRDRRAAALSTSSLQTASTSTRCGHGGSTCHTLMSAAGRPRGGRQCLTATARDAGQED